MSKQPKQPACRSNGYAVLSWEDANPRATFRLDGYYVDQSMARDMVHYEEDNGRRAMLLRQVPKEPFLGIPTGLFKRHNDPV